MVVVSLHCTPEISNDSSMGAVFQFYIIPSQRSGHVLYYGHRSRVLAGLRKCNSVFPLTKASFWASTIHLVLLLGFTFHCWSDPDLIPFARTQLQHHVFDCCFKSDQFYPQPALCGDNCVVLLYVHWYVQPEWQQFYFITQLSKRIPIALLLSWA